MWKASTELAGHEQQGEPLAFLGRKRPAEIVAGPLETPMHSSSLRSISCMYTAGTTTRNTCIVPASRVSPRSPAAFSCNAKLTLTSPDRAFAGTLLSTVTCASCGAQTHTEDPILDISLSLQSAHAGALTLGECFRRYTAQETLSGKAYTCARCRAVSSGTVGRYTSAFGGHCADLRG